MANSPTPPFLPGLNLIAGEYDAVICDIWGVVHDGQAPNALAIDALQAFRGGVGPVVLLSNAPRLASGVKLQFDRIGVPHDCYDAILTSGELTRAHLKTRTGASAPLPIFYLGPDRDLPAYEGLNLLRVGPDAAELVLCIGPFRDEIETPDDYRDLLAQFLARKLPMLCANPDVIVQRGEKIVYCAGAIAERYESMGGDVVYFGKPHEGVFEAALAMARGFGPARRPLVIGDGLATDILGANRVGWDALFINSGLYGGKSSLAEVQALLAEHGLKARAVMDRLTW